MSLNADILAAFKEVTAPDAKKTHAWVKPYTSGAAHKDAHQFLFFLKPEITADYAGVKVDKVVDVVTKALADAQIDVGSVRVVSGDYLDHHNLMVEHYGVISKISKEGVAAISDAAKAKLNEVYKDALAAGAEVLGGHQFLAKYKEFNPFSLLVFNDNLGTTRLAGGTYAMMVKVLGKPYILLNPFHAYQLVPYTSKGHALIVFEGLSKRPWVDLRQKVAGVTDPKAALDGSIRKLLLNMKSELGLGDVDKGTNGIHMSAGPLEGLVEVQRFFSDHETGKKVTPAETAFGALLAAKGLNDEKVAKLVSNPDFDKEGKKVSAFDLTEEVDAAAAADTLASLV
jgi:predicted peroxiredoxin